MKQGLRLEVRLPLRTTPGGGLGSSQSCRGRFRQVLFAQQFSEFRVKFPVVLVTVGRMYVGEGIFQMPGCRQHVGVLPHTIAFEGPVTMLHDRPQILCVADQTGAQLQAEQIPEKLVVNVDKLELGQVIKVGELTFENVEVMSPKNAVVCAVKMTRAAQSAAGAQTFDEEGEEHTEGEEAPAAE